MDSPARKTAVACAVVLALAALTALPQVSRGAACQGRVPCPTAAATGASIGEATNYTSSVPHVRVKRAARRRVPAQAAPKTAPAAQKKPPSRGDFTAEQANAAVVPGIPGARFWADDDDAYRAELGGITGPWLALSAGGEDSAFGAGLLTGLSESGKRPDYAVVTGVSSGALLSPFVFLGSSHDADLKRDFVAISAADVFEDRRTAESLFDTWPLRDFIGQRVTPALLAEIAAEHRRGRRLIVVTTNIDTGRPVAWNMGAIAAAGGDAAMKLFRDVLLASCAIPGMFPPVLIEVEANGKKFQEMHMDGGLAATIYAAPDSMLLASDARHLPMKQLTVILNSKLVPEFEVTDRTMPGVLGRALSIGVKRATRSAAILLAAAAQHSGTEFNVAYVDQGFDMPSHGLFDPEYMKALFDVGMSQGRSTEPFRHSLTQAAPQPVAPQPPQARQ